MTRVLVAVCVVVRASAPVTPVVASSARQHSEVARVFTAAQADEGRVAYGKSCASCHMADLSGNADAPPLAGANFMSAWGARTTKELFDYVSAAMPPGGPSQRPETYAAIVAHLLRSNGAPPGPDPLTPAIVVRIDRIAKIRNSRIRSSSESLDSKECTMRRGLVLIARGDLDHDNALDPIEIQKVAITPPPPPPVLMRGASHAGGYGFADEDSISSLSHIESSLEDLRLASDVKEQALPIVKAFAEALDADASAKLLQEMESLLTVEQLADFRSAIDPRNPQRVFFINRLGASGANVFMVGPNLARRIEQYGLAGAQKDQALAAIERFKAKLRPGEPDRNVLLDQVKSILSDEERDNFRAALERRPLTKAGGVISGVVGGSFLRTVPVVPPVRAVPPRCHRGCDRRSS